MYISQKDALMLIKMICSMGINKKIAFVGIDEEIIIEKRRNSHPQNGNNYKGIVADETLNNIFIQNE